MPADHANPDPLAANKAVALAFFAAVADGDIPRIEALLAPDARWWALGSGDRERDSFIGALSQTIARSSSRSTEVVGITAEGDRVAVETRGAFHFAEGDYCNTYHFLFVIRDGQIVQGKEYLDTTVARAFFPARTV